MPVSYHHDVGDKGLSAVGSLRVERWEDELNLHTHLRGGPTAAVRSGSPLLEIRYITHSAAVLPFVFVCHLRSERAGGGGMGAGHIHKRSRHGRVHPPSPQNQVGTCQHRGAKSRGLVNAIVQYRCVALLTLLKLSS